LKAKTKLEQVTAAWQETKGKCSGFRMFFLPHSARAKAYKELERAKAIVAYELARLERAAQESQARLAEARLHWLETQLRLSEAGLDPWG